MVIIVVAQVSIAMGFKKNVVLMEKKPVVIDVAMKEMFVMKVGGLVALQIL